MNKLMVIVLSFFLFSGAAVAETAIYEIAIKVNPELVFDQHSAPDMAIVAEKDGVNTIFTGEKAIPSKIFGYGEAMLSTCKNKYSCNFRVEMDVDSNNNLNFWVIDLDGVKKSNWSSFFKNASKPTFEKMKFFELPNKEGVYKRGDYTVEITETFAD